MNRVKPSAQRPGRTLVSFMGSGRMLALCVLPLVARADWVPHPLTHYPSSPAPAGSEPGVRRFSHTSVHEFPDGAQLDLHWEVDADPDSILALDVEHEKDGVHMMDCTPNQLVLHVSKEHASRVHQWRHVTGSEEFHRCSHLEGMDMYHRVTRVHSITEQKHPLKGSLVTLATEELGTHSQVFSHCHYSLNILPAAVRYDKDYVDQNEEMLPARRNAEVPPRRLGFMDAMDMDNDFKPTTQEHHSLLNLDVPRQVSKLGWNWDYDANTTRDPQFKYVFPGGLGWVRLMQPYLKARFRIKMNFTSDVKGLGKPPHVQVKADVQGFADFNLNIATAISFKSEKSAGVLDDVLQRLHKYLPGMPNPGGDQNFLTPLKFSLGGTPLTIKPGFSCKLKGYHVGQLRGSLRVALATTVFMHGYMDFDTDKGMQTNFSAQAKNVSFTPPTWLLFTRHFELGMMLEPMLSFKGGFGSMQDMELGFIFRPYINMSLNQEGGGPGPGEVGTGKGLAVFPYRVVGLPEGKNYSIKISANGINQTTSSQLSTGVIEFMDSVENFYFGSISQTNLLGTAVEVSVLEDGLPVGKGEARCSSVVNGQCQPSPITANIKVGGKNVVVHINMVWDDNAVNTLENKIKSVTLRFPDLKITNAQTSAKLQDAATLAAPNTFVRLTRNGRTFEAPLAVKNVNVTDVYKSQVIYDLGPCFLSAWKSSPTNDANINFLQTPKLDLVINGVIEGSGTMPPVNWDQDTASQKFAALPGSIRSQLKTVPVTVPLYPPNDASKSSQVGTGEIEIDVLPPSQSAFWIHPYEASQYRVGDSYTFAWTLISGKPGVAKRFTLTAMEIANDGTLTPTTWQQKDLSLACSKDSKVEVVHYTANIAPCAYSYKVTIPSSLSGKHVVIVATWAGGGMYAAPHWMVSNPVEFVPGRRLGSSSNESRRLQATPGALAKKIGFGPTQAANKGWGISNEKSVAANSGFGHGNGKMKQKMANLKSHCSAAPMKYRFNAGMNFVERMKNVIIPFHQGVGGMGSKPDWTSKPAKLWKFPGEGTQGDQELKDILPKSLCAGGVCDGMMPSCQETKANPINIPMIVFKLSRLFKWKNHVGPKMRHIIAYALALTPSMVDLSQKQAADFPGGNRRLEPKHEPEGVWFAEKPDGEEDDEEFDTVTATITEPIDYELTEDRLSSLLAGGHFAGLEDGREATHGPVKIVSFELREHDDLGAEALFEEMIVPHVLSTKPATLTRTSTVLGVLGLCAMAVAIVRTVVFRRDYTLVRPVEVSASTQEFS